VPPGEGVAFGSEPRDAGVLNVFGHAFNERFSGTTRSCRFRDEFHEARGASLPACVKLDSLPAVRDGLIRLSVGLRDSESSRFEKGVADTAP